MASCTTGDLGEEIRDRNMANLLKCILAGFETKDALKQFVTDKMVKLQKSLLQQTGNINCGVCSTPNLIKCPTPRICRGNPCKFHTSYQYQPCPKAVCTKARDFIVNLHRFSPPSWYNTDAKKWHTNPWELAKCFLPPDGYADKHSADDTDFNGIINVIINCKEFEVDFADDLRQTTNICVKARDVFRNIRHASDTDIPDCDMFNVIQTLKILLSDKKCLMGLIECQAALSKLDQIKESGFNIESEAKTRQLEVLQESKNFEGKLNDISAKVDENSKDIEHLKAVACVTHQETHEKMKSDFEEDLRGFYKKFKSFIPIYPLVPEIIEKIENIYVTPNIIQLSRGKRERRNFHCQTSQRRLKSTEALRDILFHKKRVVNEVYIEGEPGVGKTSFCIKLASSWASNQESFTSNKFFDPATLSQFRFVFLVLLRDCSGRECNIEKIIKRCIMSRLKPKYSFEFLQKVMDEEKCLVILDGLDEWWHPNEDSCECGAWKMIPFRRMLENCTFLTTTRPWKMALARIPDNEIDRQFKITGVKNPNDLVRLAIESFNKRSYEQKQAQDFMQTIEIRNLTHFLDIPVLNMQLLYLWCNDIQLGDSVSKIYKDMIDMLFCQVRLGCSSGSFLVCQSEENESTGKLLDKLGKLAFETLVKHEREMSIVFDLSEVNANLSNEERIMALRVGILTQRPFRLESAVFSFLHKTFQEYLAARHIAFSTSTPDSEVRTLANLQQQMIQIHDVEVFFKFMCGINGHSATIFSESLMESICRDCEKRLQAIGTENSVYDLQNIGLIQQAQNLILKGCTEAESNKVDVELYLTHLTDKNIKQSGNLELWKKHIQMNQKRIVSVHFEENHEQKITDLMIAVFTHSFDTLVYVSLKNQHEEINLIQCTMVKYMCIENDAKTLANTTNMVTCSLHRVSEKTEIHMFSSLKESKILQKLHISLCRNVEELVGMLPSLGTLLHLNICHVNFTNSPLTRLSKSIRYVLFQTVTINADTLETVTVVLLESKHAVTFKLMDCTVVPCEKFKAFKTMIKSSERYTVLKDGCKIINVNNVEPGCDEIRIFKYSVNPSISEQFDNNEETDCHIMDTHL